MSERWAGGNEKDIKIQVFMAFRGTAEVSRK